MTQLKRRVGALEQDAGQGDISGARVVFIRGISPMNDAGEYLTRLCLALIMGANGNIQVKRGDGEALQDFLGRVAVAYESLHGPVPDGWYERQDDAA